MVDLPVNRYAHADQVLELIGVPGMRHYSLIEVLLSPADIRLLGDVRCLQSVVPQGFYQGGLSAFALKTLARGPSRRDQYAIRWPNSRSASLTASSKARSLSAAFGAAWPARRATSMSIAW